MVFGAVNDLLPWNQTLQHQKQKNRQKVTGGERREMREHKTMERGEAKLVTGIVWMGMHSDGEEEE